MDPDTLRLLAFPLLVLAAVHDQRERLVPAWIWPLVVALGLVAIDLQPSSASHMVASVAVLGAVSVSLAFIGAFGMADVKALITTGVLLPVAPEIGPFPLVDGSIPLFPLVVAMNAMLFAMAYPMSVAVRNAMAGRWSLEMASVIEVEDVSDVHGWVHETGEDLMDVDVEGPVDVVPGVPYLVPFLAGVVFSVVVGDPTGLL